MFIIDFRLGCNKQKNTERLRHEPCVILKKLGRRCSGHFLPDLIKVIANNVHNTGNLIVDKLNNLPVSYLEIVPVIDEHAVNEAKLLITLLKP